MKYLGCIYIYEKFNLIDGKEVGINLLYSETITGEVLVNLPLLDGSQAQLEILEFLTEEDFNARLNLQSIESRIIDAIDTNRATYLNLLSPEGIN